MSVDFVMDWLNAHRVLVGWMVVGSAIMFVASVIAVPWMLVRIPHDYFGPVSVLIAAGLCAAVGVWLLLRDRHR